MNKNLFQISNLSILPGIDMEPTSGTTINVPVKSHLSPAWAVSTASARNTISTLQVQTMGSLMSYFSPVYLAIILELVRHAILNLAHQTTYPSGPSLHEIGLFTPILCFKY